MSEKASTSSHTKAKEQRKPRGTRSTKDIRQSKDEKELLRDEKKDDDIKTEPSDIKYCKKELENNWNKYETRMETYEEYEKKENMGADYMELSKIPFSSGDHFQFKHEKITYDKNPTEYDKHFQCNIDTLSAALLSISFFERNCLDKSIFRPGELENMIHRSNKFANKYKNMVKKNTEVVVTADAVSQASNTPILQHDSSKATTTDLLPNITDVLTDDVTSSEAALLNIAASPSCKSKLDVDELSHIVKDMDTKEVECTLVDQISTTKIDVIAPSNKKINENPPKSADDLEKWLDDFLDDS